MNCLLALEGAGWMMHSLAFFLVDSGGFGFGCAFTFGLHFIHFKFTTWLQMACYGLAWALSTTRLPVMPKQGLTQA